VSALYPGVLDAGTSGVRGPVNSIVGGHAWNPVDIAGSDMVPVQKIVSKSGRAAVSNAILSQDLLLIAKALTGEPKAV
jgi:hypothetical protein